MLRPVLGVFSAYSEIQLVADPLLMYQGVSVASGTSASVTVSATGGDGSYTHAWTIEDDGGGGLTGITADTSATTAFTFSGLSAINDSIIATVKDTVTDGHGNTAELIYTLSIYRFA